MSKKSKSPTMKRTPIKEQITLKVRNHFDFHQKASSAKEEEENKENFNTNPLTLEEKIALQFERSKNLSNSLKLKSQKSPFNVSAKK